MSRLGEHTLHSHLEFVLQGIANWVQKYRDAVGWREELNRCGPEEVARVAHDLGMSTEELVSIARQGPHAADQLPKLLRALGVDPDKLASEDPTTMRSLTRFCIVCAHKGQCEHELAAGTAAENYHSYCPNAIVLDSLLNTD